MFVIDEGKAVRTSVEKRIGSEIFLYFECHTYI